MGKKKQVVTNAMRLLDAAGIWYEAIEYETDGTVGEQFGITVAGKTGIPYEQSFKTLIARGDKTGIITVCVPVDREVDLKKLARVSGNKKVELTHARELLSLTGYVRGGVSPVGMKKAYPTFIDASCMGHDTIAISGGVCGCTLLVKSADLVRYTNATTDFVTV